MYTVVSVFFIFILYSIIGYFAEITFCSLDNKKFVWNRGFLIGPWLPIYGVGALVITFMLKKYTNDLVNIFLLSAVYCTILEYLTSLILEKLFHLRWWDYTDKKFDINGRVCLSNSILFGLSGLLIIKLVNPIIFKFTYSFPKPILLLSSIILFFTFMFDEILSIYIAYGIKKNVKKIAKEDATEAIKNEVMEFLRNHNLLAGRLLKSFPDLQKINGKKMENFTITYNNINVEIKKMKLARHKK